jgi:RNase P/RNase MRP subunit p30
MAYFDLSLNYDNPGNKNIDKLRDFHELLTSAICDGYCVLAVNSHRRGVIANTDTPQYHFDLKTFFPTYSIKFLNSENCALVDYENLKIMSRLTIEVSDSKDLYQFSNPNNALKSYDILAVIPKNEKMFELCCSDVNVEIVSINMEEKFNFTSKKAQILAAIERGMFFEMNYLNFIRDSGKRSIFIANVLLLLEITKGKNMIISSFAESYFDHRSPYDILTIFESIFEIKKEAIKKMLSENCEKVILKSIQRKYFKTVLYLDEEETGVMNDIAQKNDKNKDKMMIDI